MRSPSAPPPTSACRPPPRTWWMSCACASSGPGSASPRAAIASRRRSTPRCSGPRPRPFDAGEFSRRGDYRHPRYADRARGSTDYLQGAVVAMEPATGDVRALIGGRNHQESPFNRAVNAKLMAV